MAIDTRIPVGSADVASLAERLAGELITPDHPDYETRAPGLERHDRQAPRR